MTDGEWQHYKATVRPVRKKARDSGLRAAAKPVAIKRQRTANVVERTDFAAGSPQLPRLDLHGMTEAAAHAALHDFVIAQHAEGARQLLIITGKGRGGDGILRRNLPLWCEHPALQRLITELALAPPRLGGSGAFLVSLSKPKP